MFETPTFNVHIHIFPPDSKEIIRYLAFRDQLRASAEDRLAYENVQRMLAKRAWENMSDYTDTKAEVIESIIENGLRTFTTDAT